MANTRSAPTGKRRTDRWDAGGTPAVRIKSDTTEARLVGVTLRAYLHGIAVQSDYFRKHAAYVACAASLGYITTRLSPRSSRCGHHWRITKAGFSFLERTHDAV